MQISREAIDLIVREEVSSEALYRKKYTRPIWPELASGVTIGIGYDVGYSTPARLNADWKGRIPQGMIDALERACGVRGSQARGVAASLRNDVVVPWEAAISEFIDIEIPRWVKKVQAVVPNTEMLSPDCLGVLVSIAYNRGPAFANSGSRFNEMRAIRQYMKTEEFDKIPDQIRSMKRLWPNHKGLRDRREREALLFERGLRKLPTTPHPKPEAPPLPSPPVEEDIPDTKPPIKSKTIWASIIGILTWIWAAVEGALTSPYFWVFLVFLVVFLYVIWERNGKPDIRGWFRETIDYWRG